MNLLKVHGDLAFCLIVFIPYLWTDLLCGCCHYYWNPLLSSEASFSCLQCGLKTSSSPGILQDFGTRLRMVKYHGLSSYWLIPTESLISKIHKENNKTKNFNSKERKQFQSGAGKWIDNLQSLLTANMDMEEEEWLTSLIIRKCKLKSHCEPGGGVPRL